MSPLEALLKLSLIRGELIALGTSVDPKSARVVTYAANVLNLLVTPANDAENPGTSVRCRVRRE